MVIKYKAVMQKLPNAKEGEQPKYYARICNRSTMNLRELGRYIGERTSISGLDVGFVIEALLEYIPVLLLEGRSISLDDFGIFSISLTSKPSDSPENVTAADIIKVNVQFRPGPEFKRALTGAKFEKAG